MRDKADDVDLYLKILRIRMIEEAIAKRYKEGKMRCPVHLSIGQEAAAVGVCAALLPNDKMVSTHRSHAHYLAKGGSLKGLIGELYGKSTGCSRGNGGSMHLIDLSVNFWGSTSIVGGTIPVGVGLAFADYLRGDVSTTVICIGDAAIEEGVFHEAANFASLHDLNVIFVLENNLYSCYTNIKNRQPDRPISDVARAHKLSFLRTKENDAKDIMNSVYSVCRPALIEIPTYRYLQHCGPDKDDELGYRSYKEILRWRHKDPLNVNYCIGHPTDGELGKIILEIDQAFASAEEAPFPDETEMGKYTYAELQTSAT